MPVCKREDGIRCDSLSSRCQVLEPGHRQGRAGTEVHGQVCGSSLDVSTGILWVRERKDLACLLFAGVSSCGHFR